MPTVPSISGPSVQARGANVRQNVSASPNDFGASIGQALQQTGQNLAQASTRMAAEDSQAQVKDNVTQFRELMRDKMHIGDDPYYSRKGKLAYETYDSQAQELKELQNDFTGRLSNDRQKETFRAITGGYLNAEFDVMSKHARRGRSEWLNSTDESIINQAVKDNVTKPFNNGTYKDQIVAANKNLQKRNGWSAEEAKLRTDADVTKMHMNSINRLMIKTPEVAQQYYDSKKDEIDPLFQDQIEKQLESQSDASFVMTAASDIRLRGGSRTERLNNAREAAKDDPKRQRELIRQVEHDFAQEKAAKQEKSIDTFNKFGEGMRNGLSLTELRQNQPALWNSMNEQQKRSLNSGSKASDRSVYLQLRGLVAQNEKTKSLNFLEKSSGSLSQADYKKFADQIAKIDTAGVTKNVETNQAHFNNAMQTVIGKKPKGGQSLRNYSTKRNTLMGIYQDGIDEYFDNNPNSKQIPRTERQKILDDMTIELKYESDSFFNFGGILNDEVSIDDVPAEEMQSITEALNSLGLPVSVEGIINTYNSTDKEKAEINKILKSNGVETEIK